MAHFFSGPIDFLWCSSKLWGQTLPLEGEMMVEASVGRLQAASGQAVEALIAVARGARRDGDRVRASVAILDHSNRALAGADALHGENERQGAAPVTTTALVNLL